MDLLASVFGGDKVSLISGFDSLLEDAAGFSIHFNFRLCGNKRIDGIRLSHTFNVSQMPRECKETS